MSAKNKEYTHRKAETFKLYKPEYVAGPDLVQMVQNFEEQLTSSGAGNPKLTETIDNLSYIRRTDRILITGSPDDITEVIALLKEFDTPQHAQEELLGNQNRGFLVYKLQYQNGLQLVDALQSIAQSKGFGEGSDVDNLLAAINSVQAIDITNSILASGDQQSLAQLKGLIENLDRPLKQVFIEVLVLSTTASNDMELGLNWGSQGTFNEKLGWSLGNFGPEESGGSPAAKSGFTNALKSVDAGDNRPSGGQITPLSSGYLSVIGDIIWHKGKSYAGLGSLVNALETDGTTTVILSQKIVVQDNKNAKIFSGDNVPFTGSLVTTSGLTQTTNANLEYRNIGVTLSLTPIIGESGAITLDIDEEISEEVNEGSSGGSPPSSTSVNGIRTTKTNMQTSISVPDKHFLILSGTMRNQVVRAISTIPCLGALPVIGALFTQLQKNTINRNLVIFIKPHIIDSIETYQQITEKQEDVYGSSSQSNTDDFYKGIELIRSPDDADECSDDY